MGLLQLTDLAERFRRQAQEKLTRKTGEWNRLDAALLRIGLKLLDRGQMQGGRIF
jgi:hypothetical protein